MRVLGGIGFVAAVALGAASAEAQAVHTPDTLRYSEISRSTMVLTGPQGEVSVESEHDAILAVTWLWPDSAHAWYESLSLLSRGPQGEMRPATDSVLGQRFVLAFDRVGHPRAVRTPDFPPEVRQVTDLSRQFYDFFLPRPSEPLGAGVAWTDTVGMAEEEAATGGTFESRKIGRYEVVADSVVGGTAVWVVRAAVEQRMESRRPVPNRPGLTAVQTLGGLDEGTFFIAKSNGRLLGRSRSGLLEGELVYEGGPQPVRFPVVLRYTNEVSRER